MQNKTIYWQVCKECMGIGRKKQRIRKKVQLHYKKNLAVFETNKEGFVPIPPKASSSICTNCSGSGLIAAANHPVPNHENYPHVAIIGGGIGGVALAVACLQRGIPFTIYERDNSFNSRSQGYGLTLQQASKAIESFGIFKLSKGVVSTRHLVHTPNGKIIAEWGMRKWLNNTDKLSSRRTNIHIARQSLRAAFIEQLGGDETIKWGHRLINFNQNNDQSVSLNFQVNGEIKSIKADLVVGADGIRSIVRNLLINEETAPLRYLGCIVILGICSLRTLDKLDTTLLDSKTVFQTANGTERIYIMPYDSESVMWQLSFPMLENDAKELSAKGIEALKEEAILRTNWHTPIPEILAATLPKNITGYPVYDRALLNTEMLENAGSATLIGDAAHPMSPFKGQGANQALLDALYLAREIFKGCKPLSQWQKKGIRQSVLANFELEMLQRSAIKVKDSADAAQFLHSEIALYEGNEPRGKVLKRNKI